MTHFTRALLFCGLFVFSRPVVPLYSDPLQQGITVSFMVANTRFTTPLMRRGKTKFATVNWYNLCLQIIQSQTCYPLIFYILAFLPDTDNSCRDPAGTWLSCHSDGPQTYTPHMWGSRDQGGGGSTGPNMGIAHSSHGCSVKQS